jgi:hypothetical protein
MAFHAALSSTPEQHHQHQRPRPTQPQPTPWILLSPPSITLARSPRTVSRHTITPIRITLPPNNPPILPLDQILVLDRLPRRQTHAHKPKRVAAGVLGSAESYSFRHVPTPERRDAADNVDCLAEGCGAAFVEGYGCEGWGRCAGAGCCGRGGRGGARGPSGVGCGAAGAGGGAAGAG